MSDHMLYMRVGFPCVSSTIYMYVYIYMVLKNENPCDIHIHTYK